jgi:hypothetical protein
VQTYSTVNKIITENCPNLKKVLPIQIQEATRTPNGLDQNRTSPQHIIKTISTENQEEILKSVRDKIQIMYKGKPIKLSADFSTETLKARWAWSEVFEALNENNFSPRVLYPAKVLFKIDRAIKIFYNKQELKQYMTIKPPLQKILQGILLRKYENKQNQEKVGSMISWEKKRQVIRE